LNNLSSDEVYKLKQDGKIDFIFDFINKKVFLDYYNIDKNILEKNKNSIRETSKEKLKSYILRNNLAVDDINSIFKIKNGYKVVIPVDVYKRKVKLNDISEDTKRYFLDDQIIDKNGLEFYITTQFTKEDLDFIEEILEFSEKNEKSENFEDINYVIDSNSISSINLSAPKKIMGTTNRFLRDKKIRDAALKDQGFLCSCNGEQGIIYFDKENGERYVEGHHIIPMEFQEEFKNIINLDSKSNIACLCVMCHKKIHCSKDIVKKEIINNIFNALHENLRDFGIDKQEDLYKYYNISAS